MSTPQFWGDVGVKKWSQFLDLGARSPIFGHLKMGTFAKSAHFQVPENRFWSARIQKLRPLFHANIPPKWWSRHLFHVFTVFGQVLSKFSNLANNSPNIGKRIKQMSIPPFWGDVGVKKWSPFLDSGARSPIFGHLEMGKVPTFRCPKMGLRVPESKNGDHFFTPTSPQNGGIDICFMRLPLLGELLANFEKSPFFSRFPM